MKARWLLFVILASSLTFLATLYLPWESVGLTGWSVGTSEVGALLALFVAGVCIADLARPGLADRLPLGRATLALGCLELAGFITVRDVANQSIAQQTNLSRFFRHGPTPPTSTHYAYGAYLTLACGTVLLVAAAALWRVERARTPSARAAATMLLALGLVASLAVLPWRHVNFAHLSFSSFPLEGVVGALAATAICFGVATSTRRPGERLLWFSATAVLAAAAMNPGTSFPGFSYRYGAWVGIGLTLALIALAAPAAITVRSRWCVSRRSVLAAVPAALLLAALFAPWEKFCYPAHNPHNGVPRQLSGACLLQSGWSFSVGPTLGVLAVVLLAAVALTRVRLPRIELAVAAAVLTATLAFELDASPDLNFAYGAYAGFAAAALVLVVGLSEVRIRRVPLRRLLIGLVPMLAALLCVAIVVGPTWGVLPNSILERVAAIGRLGWLDLVFAALGIWLVGTWVRHLSDRTRTCALVLIPAGMLAVQTLDLIEARDMSGISLARWILLPALPVLLLVLGWMEEHGGLERLRLPQEIWRVDRISAGED